MTRTACKDEKCRGGTIVRTSRGVDTIQSIRVFLPNRMYTTRWTVCDRCGRLHDKNAKPIVYRGMKLFFLRHYFYICGVDAKGHEYGIGYRKFHHRRFAIFHIVKYIAK